MNIHRRVLEERGWSVREEGKWFRLYCGVRLVNLQSTRSRNDIWRHAPAADANFAELEVLPRIREWAKERGFWITSTYGSEGWRITIHNADIFAQATGTLCAAVEELYLKCLGIEL